MLGSWLVNIVGIIGKPKIYKYNSIKGRFRGKVFRLSDFYF